MPNLADAPTPFGIRFAGEFRPAIFVIGLVTANCITISIADNERERLLVADGSGMGLRVSGGFDDALRHGEHIRHVDWALLVGRL